MRRFRKNIIHNRIFNILFASTFLFVLLIGRLYWIQIKNYDSLKIQALKQRSKEVNLSPNRGIIYDRNLIPLTNKDRITTIFAFKNNIMSNEKLKSFIINNSTVDKENLDEYINFKGTIVDIPLKFNVEGINNSKDIFTADRILRYGEKNILSHVIGYINKSENKGEAGIEKAYDEILKNGENQSLYIELDEKKNIILGGEYTVNQKINSMEPNGVKLTVDYHIQKIVENILDSERKNGAVIVADVESGDIVAMASRPNFNQKDIDEYLDRDDMVLYNKAVQVAYPPGSLFKTVVLLTALEEDLSYVDKSFYCKGYEQINNVTIKCNNVDGHGHINLKEAFSKSCNSAFIQLGQELGSKKIIDMSKKLGFGEKINIGLLEEIEGNLPSGKELQGPSIGNISIGQGSIETTPLQITNMMMIVANKGIKKGMSIVDGITTKDGYMIKKFNRGNEDRIVSEKSCEIAQDYLLDVVLNGTARSLNLEEIGGAGGKTGSAQAVLNGREAIHGWFSGFYPAKNPKYVVTVLVEEGISGSKTAVPIFEKIIKEIYRISR
jgi:peptidoglycan glycosyltransferase/penicillin-binding protein 2